jgi:hypothetical protein
MPRPARELDRGAALRLKPLPQADRALPLFSSCPIPSTIAVPASVDNLWGREGRHWQRWKNGGRSVLAQGVAKSPQHL